MFNKIVLKKNLLEIVLDKQTPLNSASSYK